MWTQCSPHDGAVSICLPFLPAHVRTVALGLHLARGETVWMALAFRHFKGVSVTFVDICELTLKQAC